MKPKDTHFESLLNLPLAGETRVRILWLTTDLTCLFENMKRC